MKGITVTEIVNTAGYNRATYYNYFGNLKDILLEFEDNVLNDVKKIIDDFSSKKDIDCIISDMLFFDVELSERIFNLCAPYGDVTFIGRLISVCAKGAEKFKAFLPFNEAEVKIVTGYILGSVGYILSLYKKQKINMPIKDISNFTKLLLSNGLKHIISLRNS